MQKRTLSPIPGPWTLILLIMFLLIWLIISIFK